MTDNKKSMTALRAALPYVTVISALFISAFLSLRFGAAYMSTGDFFEALSNSDGTNSVILYSIRLPRVLAAILAGMGLSVSGVLLQVVTDNGLSSPSVIGVNAGAGVGVVLSLLIFPAFLSTAQFVLTPVFAFLGAFLTTLLVILLAERVGGSKLSIVLSGVAISSVLNAFISAVTLIDTDILTSYNSFSIGGFSGVEYKNILVPGIITVLSLLIASLFARDADLLCLGNDAAISLGVRVKTIRIILIICASASAAAAVSFAGLLGFVGLIAPHAARSISGGGTRKTILFSAALGAVLTTLADLFGRIILAPTEIPVGITMAFIGAPFFVILLYRKRGEYLES